MNLQDTLNNRKILNNKENITILTNKIVDDFFYKNPNAKTFVIPESVTKIGEYAFQNCTSLEKITIPDSVTKIGNGAFDGCKNLKEITIPDSVTKIDGGAFYGCKNLTQISIPDSVTEIGECAFENCKNLTEINIPDSVTRIGDDAFNSCENLKEIIFQNPSSLNQMKLGENVFSGCDLENINITFLDNKLDKEDMTNSISDTKKDENDLEL